MARQFATRLGLLAFAASTAEALGTGVDLGSALTTALWRLALFYGLGWVCGELARRLVEEDAQQEFANWKAAADAPQASSP